MITQLTGTIICKQPPSVVIDVNGVGYEVLCPMSTFYHLPEINRTTTLLTQLIVREDAQLLYGFAHSHERELFRALIKVNGVGPKLALTILSGIEPKQFTQCIRDNDASRLVRIPGVGKKTAARLVIEMRDILEKTQLNTLDDLQKIMHNPSATEDAISALMALGYKSTEARNAVAKVAQQSNNRETLIRLALQQMTKGITA